MLILELYDRNGEKLQLGDLVKISNGKSFDFYAEVTYLKNEQVIAPFHTFTFKVDAVPEGVVKSFEQRYNVWYLPSRDQFDTDPQAGEKYLQSWRACEYKLEKNMFRIKIQEP